MDAQLQTLIDLQALDTKIAALEAEQARLPGQIEAIQAAVDFSRDHQMAYYFPGGDYLVSDTIVCLQRLTVRANGRISGGTPGLACSSAPAGRSAHGWCSRPARPVSPTPPGASWCSMWSIATRPAK